jgi:Uma2 family endonuclease
MNLRLRHRLTETTRAAEGRDRRAWTVEEVEAMVRAGIIAENERLELIGGELVPMSAKGAFHEDVKIALTIYWARRLPPETIFAAETTLRASRIDFREPDFVVWPKAVRVADLKPSDVQLIVEIADSSLDYDLGDKMRYYASLGIPEYWVIEARSLVTHIHRAPSADAYGSITRHDRQVRLVPFHVPALAVSLTGLGLEPA